MMPNKILIIDDDVVVAEVIKSIVANAGYTPVVALNSPVLGSRRLLDFRAVILDLWLSDGFFEDSLHALARLNFRGGLVLMSGLDDEVLYEAAQMATNLGLDLLGYLHKPVRTDMLLDTLSRLKLSGGKPLQAPELPRTTLVR
ncbi:MAG: hypothetical protein RLZZ385_822 [Pseudomonadota bacterium]|jgi:DNA-binding NtrC family response regulator